MEKGEYPLCKCGQAMVWSFALNGNECVCAPCRHGEPMFNGRDKVLRNIYYMNAKKAKWGDDLTVVARRISGATCAMCKDKSCRWCKITEDKNYKFKYWGKNKS